MTPEAYCRDRTRGSGSSFFYAFLFLDEDQRRAMLALYAFCREVDDIADEVKEQEVALSKLAFWRQELAEAFSGQPQHPVGKELSWTADNFPINEELLVEIIDGMLMDVKRQPILKQTDLALYTYRVAGVVGLLTIEIFGYKNRKSRDFATSLGEALQLTNILRDVAEDAKIGRIYFPQEARIRYRVNDQDFMDGNMSEGMQHLLTDYANRAESAYQKAMESLADEDRESLRPSILMASIYYIYLRRLRSVNFDVWRHPVHVVPLRKIWTAWKTWRYEARAVKKTLPLKLEF